MSDLSSKMLVFLALLTFVILAKAVDAYESRGISRKAVTSSQDALKEQLSVVQTSLQDIRQRLTSIEDVLHQVE